jgi:hypothetical protein
MFFELPDHTFPFQMMIIRNGQAEQNSKAGDRVSLGEECGSDERLHGRGPKAHAYTCIHTTVHFLATA